MKKKKNTKARLYLKRLYRERAVELEPAKKSTSQVIKKETPVLVSASEMAFIKHDVRWTIIATAIILLSFLLLYMYKDSTFIQTNISRLATAVGF